MGNYIKFYRDILEWEWWADINTCRLFIYILLKANWKDSKFKGVDVPRGSFVTSVKKLSLETSLTEDEVRTALKHLVETGEVTKQTTNKFTVITVSNYDLYQEVPKQIPDNYQTDTEQLPNNSQSIPNLFPTIEEEKERETGKQDKQENREECITPPLPPSQGETEEKTKRKRFTPPTLEEVQAYCLERNNGIDAQSFIDFYESKGWMIGKNKMKDWRAAVRTWERGRSRNNREHGNRDILSEWRNS